MQNNCHPGPEGVQGIDILVIFFVIIGIISPLSKQGLNLQLYRIPQPDTLYQAKHAPR